ncbi:MAG TPA: hypothetical protein DCE58_03990 [Cryomorphaceae bacterium]|nr:hypothetical protein [Cryomorphaceae bacterium]
MKRPFALLALGSLAFWRCEPTIYCDLAFHSVGFSWLDTTTTPTRIIPVVVETQDTLTNNFTSIFPAFTVVSDEHQSYFFQKTYHVMVYVLDSTGNILIDSQYIITADECHIQKISGPEYLP